ncbi:hypothetical protein HGM15179_022471, partial [Zosterops borbonicus]
QELTPAPIQEPTPNVPNLPVVTNSPDVTSDKDLATLSLTTTSVHKPFRLRLTEPLHLTDSDWYFVSVNPNEPGTWSQIEGKFVVIGDCKFTPREVEIAPGLITSNPERFVLWLHCVNPPVVVGKDGTGRTYEYDCMVKNTADIKPVSEIEMEASFEM